MDPTHRKLKNLDPTQPMGQPKPWTTLHSHTVTVYMCVTHRKSPLAIVNRSWKCSHINGMRCVATEMLLSVVVTVDTLVWMHEALAAPRCTPRRASSQPVTPFDALVWMHEGLVSTAASARVNNGLDVADDRQPSRKETRKYVSKS